MKKNFLKLITIVAVTCLSLVSGQVSFADDFGTGNYAGGTGNKADNGWHDYCTIYSWGPAWQQPLDDAMARLSSQTVMTTHWQSLCQNWIDAQFRITTSAELGSNYLGATSCVSGELDAVNHVCGGSSILLNSDNLTDYTKRRKTICHEVGHSVGLSHSDTATDCMVNRYFSNDWYGSHHISHINGAY